MDNEKKSYLQKLADKMVELDKKLDELKQQGNEAGSVIKEDYTKMAEELKVKRKEAEVKLNELRQVSGEGWDEIKKGAEKAFGELSTAFENALAKFKKPPQA
ncbi:MAG: coiled coil domain-containing protein [Spirochaetes bacterium]|nr:coiled coil domain-containing protein [Spirochaetota bacterium]